MTQDVVNSDPPMAPQVEPLEGGALEDAARLYERPGFLLRRAHQISVAIFESACADISLTPAQYAVLVVLRADSTLDQTSVGRAIGLDKVTASLLLRGLEARGLVDRRPVPHNRRQRSLTLTPLALELLRRSRAPTEAAYEKLMAPLGAEQRLQFIEMLQQLVSGLESCARAPLQPIVRSVDGARG